MIDLVSDDEDISAASAQNSSSPKFAVKSTAIFQRGLHKSPPSTSSAHRRGIQRATYKDTDMPPLKSVDDDSDEADSGEDDEDVVQTCHRRAPPSPTASPPSPTAAPPSPPTASSYKMIPRTRTKDHMFTTQDDSDFDDYKCDSDYCPSEGDVDDDEDDDEDDGDYCTSDDDEFVDEEDDEVDGDDDSDENRKELIKKLEKVGFQSYMSSTLGGSKSESAIKTACNRIVR